MTTPTPSLFEYAAALAPKRNCQICKLPTDVLAQINANEHAEKRVARTVMSRWLKEVTGQDYSREMTRDHRTKCLGLGL